MFIIFDRSAEDALPLRQRFYRYRVHSLYLSPCELDRIDDYPVQGFLIPHPELLEDALGLAELLRSRYPHLPVATVYRPTGHNYYRLQNVSDLVFDHRTTAPKMIDELFRAYESKGNSSADRRIIQCVRTIRRSRFVYVIGEPFPTTHTQWMLTRYLILAAPRAVSAEELLELCFSPGHERSVQNVSAQLTKLDRLIRRAYPFRIFHCRHPHLYSIKRTFYR